MLHFFEWSVATKLFYTFQLSFKFLDHHLLQFNLLYAFNLLYSIDSMHSCLVASLLIICWAFVTIQTTVGGPTNFRPRRSHCSYLTTIGIEFFSLSEFILCIPAYSQACVCIPICNNSNHIRCSKKTFD